MKKYSKLAITIETAHISRRHKSLLSFNSSRPLTHIPRVKRLHAVQSSASTPDTLTMAATRVFSKKNFARNRPSYKIVYQYRSQQAGSTVSNVFKRRQLHTHRPGMEAREYRSSPDMCRLCSSTPASLSTGTWYLHRTRMVIQVVKVAMRSLQLRKRHFSNNSSSKSSWAGHICFIAIMSNKRIFLTSSSNLKAWHS